ncbi:hypothetical protein [Fluviispira sanaruensis]|uniref:Lipoprotein n=1 Tax=Fluviispira sanaruensis TaxID=2493639 RepID=A0A4P2VK10_FLUSA|nr:hypothetical protein [Fluviispira sanaruensis]BBH53593.1 hypothetical protein JCM31447_20370 [Fluviispira sanaruensis]
MKNKKILFLQFIIIVLFTSCKESEDNYIIYEKNSCNYFSYLKNFSTNKTSVNNLPISEEIFFINMENHAPIEAIINNQNSDACSEVCYDVNLNAIYESLIAKNIIENIELNKKMYAMMLI